MSLPVRSNATTILGSLLWEKVEAVTREIERSLTFVLGETDFQSLCGGKAPASEPRVPVAYYRGRDGLGNSITICVRSDAMMA